MQSRRHRQPADAQYTYFSDDTRTTIASLFSNELIHSGVGAGEQSGGSQHSAQGTPNRLVVDDLHLVRVGGRVHECGSGLMHALN